MTSEQEWNQISKQLKQDLDLFPFIGLDTEWVNDKGQGRPISMLQMATYKGIVFKSLNSVKLLTKRVLKHYRYIKSILALPNIKTVTV